MSAMEGEIEKARSEYQRMRQEGQGKIDKLSERIKDLNQQILKVK